MQSLIAICIKMLYSCNIIAIRRDANMKYVFNKIVFLLSVLLILFIIIGCELDYDLSSNEKTINISTLEQSQATTNDSKELIITPPKTEEDAVEFIMDNIKNYKYEDAWYHTKDFESKNIKTLNAYAYVLMLNEKKDYCMRNIGIRLNIDPNYDGPMSSEIKDFCLKYADIVYDKHADIENGEFVGKTVYEISETKTKAELDARIPPKIGMTKEEAYNSTWGYPDDINKTTTEYGVSEQWVYEEEDDFDIKCIYLDNGIVTAIQE